jgi:hypothetical protein
MPSDQNPIDVTAFHALARELVTLEQRLRDAFDDDGGPERPPTVDVERKRFDKALTAIGVFIDTAIGKECGEPFFRLASDFRDLNRGVTSSLLTAVPIGGPADPSWLWQDRAKVAGALEALRALNITLQDAAGMIAREYPRVGKLGGRADTRLATTIIGWHKKLSGDKVRNQQGKTLFKMVRESISEVPIDDHRDATLRDYAAKLLKDL